MKTIGRKTKIVFFVLAAAISIAASIMNCKITVQASEMDIRAVWISYLDYANLKDNSQDEFINNVNSMFDNVLNRNLNTVIVQVRAFSDAIYPSDYYGWCSYITSNGSGPGYDPLAIMIESAHARGLRIEAWINPYRISLSESYDPGDPAVKELVLAGVDEVVRNYAVDGIHFDDYFYRNGDPTPIDEKQQNVNELIRNVYSRIKSLNSNVKFGISPAGNIDNCRGAGADVDTWLSESGYIDYIMPQLYWTDQYGNDGNITMFSDRLWQWKSLIHNDVSLMVGLALYKVEGKPDNDPGWSWSNSNLSEQVGKASSAGAVGYSLFRYDFLNYPSTQEELNNLHEYTPPIDRSQIGMFVDRYYRVILDRDPDEEGMNNWVNALAEKRMTGADLLETFVMSPEFQNRNVDISEFVQILYWTCLDRGPDSSGLNYWIDAMNKGVSQRGVCANFVNSTEFKKLCKGADILPGEIYNLDGKDKNADITKFVYRCYSTILGRKPDTEGLNNNSDDLVSGNNTASNIVEHFIDSPEFRNKNYGEEDYIKILYKSCMDRESDKQGLAYWKNAIQAGMSRKGVLNGFLQSNEFGKICSQYNMNRGEMHLSEGRDKNANVTMFVYRCYNETLGRNPDTGGLNFYCDRILNREISPEDAAKAFILSPEFKNKEFSDETYIKVLYSTFLGRTFDKQGLQYYLNRLKNGVSREDILKGFSGSPEFAEIMRGFGL